MKLGAMIYSFSAAINSGQMTQREVIALCGELGLYAVDTMPGLGEETWRDVRSMVEDAGRKVSTHIISAQLALPPDAGGREAMDIVLAGIDDARALGTDKLMVVTGSVPDGMDRRAAQKRLGEAFAEVSRRSRGSGVRLCVEDFPGAQSNHRTSGDLLAVCELAGPEFGLCFDTGNFYCGGETPEEAWPRLASRVIHAHLKDWRWSDGENGHPTTDGRRLVPELVGRGILDYPGILAMMKADGFDGVLSFEYEGNMDRAQAAREGIGYLRSVLEAL